MLTWDGMDYARDHALHVPNRRRLHKLGDAGKVIADELAAIHATLEARTRDAAAPLRSPDSGSATGPTLP